MFKKIKLNTLACGAFVAVSLFFFYNSMLLKYWSSKYAPGPGFIPRWASGFLILLSVIAFIYSLKEEGITLDQLLPPDKTRRVNLYVTWGSLVFFLLFVKLIGFLPTSFVMLTSMFSRGTKLPKAALISAILTICCYIVFKVVLKVQIPTNQLGW